MNIIPRFDAATLRRVIEKDFPAIAIASFQLIDNGWDNMVVEVNHELIFRFPKDMEVMFAAELEILDRLQGKITLSIPRVKFLGKSYTYMGYQKILGSNLTGRIFNSLRMGQQETLIYDLANFLREFHAAITPAEAREMGIKDDDPHSYSHLIRSTIPPRVQDPRILDFVEKTVREYDTMTGEKIEPVLLYNDLHTENMAFDPRDGRLNGVFDFSEVMIGDVHRDFYSLYRFDPYFMKAVAEKYQELTGRRLMLRRMVIYGRINELCDLAEFIKNPESDIYQNAVARIHAWREQMDIFQQ